MVEQIVSFVVPLLYLMGTTASLVFLTKRSFGKCLPIAMMGSAFLLFFSQLIFGTFNVGFIVGILFAVASIGLGIWRRKDWKGYRGLLFSSGFIVFLTVYVLVFIYDFARGFSAWDEFSHWGMMLKEMCRLDKFYYVDASNLMVHKDYPPIMQLFELFWIKLCGGYNEAWTLRALHTFELSLFVPFIAEKVAEKKNVRKSVLVGAAGVFSIMLTMLLFDQHGVIQTIYTDYVMAIVTVFLLMTVLVNKRVTWFEIMTLAVGGGFLLLLKQMGLPLYLMVLCFFVGMVWIRKTEKWKAMFGRIGWKKLTLIVTALALPFVIWFIWGRLITDVARQFDLSKIGLMDFVKVLLGHGEEWQSFTMKKYIMALGQENISTSYIQISFLQSIVIFVGSLWGAWWVFRKKIKKEEIMFLGVTLVMGAVGYIAIMMVLYVLSFTSYEATILASFNRYMGTYAMIMILTVVMIVIWQGIVIGKMEVIYMMVIGLVLVNAPEGYKRIYPYVGEELPISDMKQVGEILSSVANDGNAVFVVTQDGSLSNIFHLQYYSNNVKINYGLNTWLVGGENVAKEYYYTDVLPVVSNYDYLYFYNMEDALSGYYCKLISKCPLKRGDIYKVTQNKEGGVDYKLLDNIK